jgi:hypothetical protein
VQVENTPFLTLIEYRVDFPPGIIVTAKPIARLEKPSLSPTSPLDVKRMRSGYANYLSVDANFE